jgi:alpha-galactosidase
MDITKRMAGPIQWRLLLLTFTLICTMGTYVAFAGSARRPNIGRYVFIHYSKSGTIKYDLSSGMFEVSFDHKTIIQDASSVFQNNGITISSKDYSLRQLTSVRFKDNFGEGKKFIVSSRKQGLPVLQQVFYTYPGRQSFLMEVILKGSTLSSSYMAPLISEIAQIGPVGDNRTLFVPFDNDAFVSYNAKSMQSKITNTSAEVGAVYEEVSRNGLVLGSVEHGVWKTGIRTTGQANKLTQLEIWGGLADSQITHDQIPHGKLRGSIIKSPKIMIGYYADWRSGMEEYGKANRLADPPVIVSRKGLTPFGWNSWGALQDKISFEKTYKIADFFSDSLKTFRNGNTLYIDLDAFWDYLVPGGTKGDFAPLKAFVDYCHQHGLKAGAYMAPFTDWGWKSGPDRKVEGTEFTYGDLWTKVNGKYYDFDGGRAIDPTHPGTKKIIGYIVNKLKASGFTMMKIDFLGHATIEADSFYDKNITTGMQAYRQGMEFLTNTLGKDMLIYAAISPSLATGRYAHMRRIACDAFKSIENTGYTLNSVNYGWWQTYLYDFVDADHIVFGNETLGANHARLTSGLITGSLVLGDDFSSEGQWKGRIRDLLANEDILKMARNGVAFEPLETNTGDKSGRFFTRVIGGTTYLAVFNFSNNPLAEDINLNKLGLNPKNTYQVKEVFTNTVSNVAGRLPLSLDQKNAAIYIFNIK